MVGAKRSAGPPAELERQVVGLPVGVTASWLELPLGMGVWPVLLEAAQDAPLAHSELKAEGLLPDGLPTP